MSCCLYAITVIFFWISYGIIFLHAFVGLFMNINLSRFNFVSASDKTSASSSSINWCKFIKSYISFANLPLCFLEFGDINAGWTLTGKTGLTHQEMAKVTDDLKVGQGLWTLLLNNRVQKVQIDTIIWSWNDNKFF